MRDFGTRRSGGRHNASRIEQVSGNFPKALLSGHSGLSGVYALTGSVAIDPKDIEIPFRDIQLSGYNAVF